MYRRTARLLVLAVMLPLALGACGGGDETLTIYSGREEDLVGSLIERFEEESGITVDVRYGDSADLALLIAEEGDNTPADVFFSQSPGAVGYLNERGALATLPSEVVSSVDSKFAASDGRWVGLSGRQRVLVYNQELVEEADLPSSVFDLTEGEFAGRVALAPTNGSFQDFVSAMALIEGEDVAQQWLNDMAESGAPTYADNSSIVDAVARGEAPMGLVNHYYNYRFLEADASLPSRNHVFPNGDIGSLLIAATASVIEASDQKEDAREFIEFMLSGDAQRFFSEETFEYPLVGGVEPASELPPLDTVQAPDFDIDRLGGELETTTRMIAESGLLE